MSLLHVVLPLLYAPLYQQSDRGKAGNNALHEKEAIKARRLPRSQRETGFRALRFSLITTGRNLPKEDIPSVISFW